MPDFSPEEIRLLLEFHKALGLRGLYFDGGQPEGTAPQLRGAAGKEQLLTELRDVIIGDCTRCGLSAQRRNIVFGEGNPDCELMFIGEGPGEDEDRQARPFVGRAGQLLRRMIDRMGLPQQSVYIANVVKCRPPANRTPLHEEIETCIPFLKRQIEIISPRVIMVLGNVALQSLLGSELKITSARGRFMQYEEIPVMPTFHPSYLLRNPKDKWLTWQDALYVLKLLGKEVPSMPHGRNEGVPKIPEPH